MLKRIYAGAARDIREGWLESVQVMDALAPGAAPATRGFGGKSGDRLGSGDLDQRATHEGRFFRSEERYQRSHFFELRKLRQAGALAELQTISYRA